MAGNPPNNDPAHRQDKKRARGDAESDERPRKSHRSGSHHSDALVGEDATGQERDAADMGKGTKSRSAERASENGVEDSEGWPKSTQSSEGVSDGHARTPEQNNKRATGTRSNSAKEPCSGSESDAASGRRRRKQRQHDFLKAGTNGEERSGVLDLARGHRRALYFAGETNHGQLQAIPETGSGQGTQSRHQPHEWISNGTRYRAFDDKNARHVDPRSTFNGKTSPYPNANTDSHSIQSSQADSSADQQNAPSGRPHIPSPFWDEHWENNNPGPKQPNQEQVYATSDTKDPTGTNPSSASKDSVPSYDDFKPIRDNSRTSKSKRNAKSRPNVSLKETIHFGDANKTSIKRGSGPVAALPPHGKTQIKDIVTLNEKYPSATPYANVPGYDHLKPLPPLRKPSDQRDPTKPPPLPPIDEKFMLPVFTHASFVDSKYGSAALETYDRLELLGDAYIEVIATRMLYSRLPDRLVGKLSRLREELVSNNSLAIFSALYGFDRRIRPDLTGLLKTQKLQKQKILGDVFEAYVAAIVESSKEHGFANAEEWLTELWAPILLEKAPDAVSENTKAILQQKLDGYHVKIMYREYRSPQHQGHGEIRFFQEVSLTGWGFENKLLGSGWGKSKGIAQMDAAKDALENADLMGGICEKKRVSEEKRKAELSRQTAESHAGV